jgi:battenin
MLASLSSGGGELSFLGLTHYYGHFSLASWGSGTGGAGLVGAGAYVIATTALGLSVRTTLLAFSFLPLIMIASFFLLLPREPLKGIAATRARYERVPEDDSGYEPSISSLDDGVRAFERVRRHFLPNPFLTQQVPQSGGSQDVFQANIARVKKLIVP